jgi:hypothetical protein
MVEVLLEPLFRESQKRSSRKLRGCENKKEPELSAKSRAWRGCDDLDA